MLGSVVRDAAGSVLGCISGYLKAVFEPKIAEAMAMKEALCWLKEKQFDHVIIESDCLEFINALNDCVSLVSNAALTKLNFFF